MSRITYITTVKVQVDGKTVGTIKEVVTPGVLIPEWRYFPKGAKNCSNAFRTLEAGQKSLEGY